MYVALFYSDLVNRAVLEVIYDMHKIVACGVTSRETEYELEFVESRRYVKSSFTYQAYEIALSSLRILCYRK
jgi:hypothetical protein